MNAIIIDDELDARELLTTYVLNFCDGVQVVADFDNPVTAYEFLSQRHEEVDLIYLDISMPEMDGIQLLKQCSSFDVQVIFVTAHEHYAIQAIRLAALDYILKPIDIELLTAATNRAREILLNKEKNFKTKLHGFISNTEKSDAEKQIIINAGSSLEFVPIKQVIYLVADSNYTEIYIEGKNKLVVTNTLGHFQERLDYPFFYRVHRSYLVNMKKITRYNKGRGGTIIMSNNAKIPVSQRNKVLFLKKLAALV